MNLNTLKKNPYFNEINKQNSVSICLRQNRFMEGRGQNTFQNKQKSWNFTLEQINYMGFLTITCQTLVYQNLFPELKMRTNLGSDTTHELAVIRKVSEANGGVMCCLLAYT